MPVASLDVVAGHVPDVYIVRTDNRGGVGGMARDMNKHGIVVAGPRSAVVGVVVVGGDALAVLVLWLVLL